MTIIVTRSQQKRIMRALKDNEKSIARGSCQESPGVMQREWVSLFLFSVRQKRHGSEAYAELILTHQHIRALFLLA
jgi:hypothetical protein